MSDKLKTYRLPEAYNSATSQSVMNNRNNSTAFNQRLVIDLSQERTRDNAFRINNNITSIFVEDTTDLNTVAFCLPTNKDIQQDPYLLEKSMRIDFTGIGEVYFYWPAQPGRKMVVQLLTENIVTNGIPHNQQYPTYCLGGVEFPLDGYYEIFDSVMVPALALVIDQDTNNLPRNLFASLSADTENFKVVEGSIADVGGNPYQFYCLELDANQYMQSLAIEYEAKRDSTPFSGSVLGANINLVFSDRKDFSTLTDFIDNSAVYDSYTLPTDTSASAEGSRLRYGQKIKPKYIFICVSVTSLGSFSISFEQIRYAHLIKMSRGI